MSEIHTEILCRHSICKCPLLSGSDFCKNAQESGTPDVVGKCGHSECVV